MRGNAGARGRHSNIECFGSSLRRALDTTGKFLRRAGFFRAVQLRPTWWDIKVAAAEALPRGHVISPAWRLAVPHRIDPRSQGVPSDADEPVKNEARLTGSSYGGVSCWVCGAAGGWEGFGAACCE